MITRRQLLQLAGVATVTAAGVASWTYVGSRDGSAYTAQPFQPYALDPVATNHFKTPLPTPGSSGLLGVLDVTGPLTIRSKVGSLPLLPGFSSPFLIYESTQDGKQFQNPILRMESGTRFKVRLENALPEPTIIHWHGIHAPSLMDGHPMSTIAAGGQYDYDFTVGNRGGTYWYHTHSHKRTAEQAYKGLASFFLVDDDEQRAFSRSLDLRFGDTDLPILLQDKRFDAQGRLSYRPDMHETMMGWHGDIIMANLTANAVLQVTPRHYRFRLLNGSNARIFRLAFSMGQHQLPFVVVGTDGGLLEKPETVQEAFLAPGERLDIVFDVGQVDPGKDVFLKSLAFDPMLGMGMMGGTAGMRGMGMMGRGGMMGASDNLRLALGEEFNLLKLAVVAGERGSLRLPATLSMIRPIANRGAIQRDIRLSMNHMQFLINDRSFRMDEIVFDVQRGATEIWNIRNESGGMPHPMHIHGFSFQVLERLNTPRAFASLGRFGQGRTVSDLGWKDTVLVWPGETVRIALDFQHNFPGDQIYLFHCHNLEHEDAGMMINFRVRS